MEGDDADSPAAPAVGTRGDFIKETTRGTDDKTVAEKTPSTDALCEERICEDVPVSSNEGGTDAPGARHEGEGLTIGKLEGLGKLERALGEQTFHIQRAWNDAMVSIKNGLVFTEVDTQVMIAKEAVDRVIETSRRFIGEAQDQAPGSPDTRAKETAANDTVGKSGVDRSTGSGSV